MVIGECPITFNEENVKRPAPLQCWEMAKNAITDLYFLRTIQHVCRPISMSAAVDNGKIQSRDFDISRDLVARHPAALWIDTLAWHVLGVFQNCARAIKSKSFGNFDVFKHIFNVRTSYFVWIYRYPLPFGRNISHTMKYLFFIQVNLCGLVNRKTNKCFETVPW